MRFFKRRLVRTFIISVIFLLIPVVGFCESFEETKAKALKGDAKAQHTLGLLYSVGVGGVAQDFKESFKWYLKSAEQGAAAAQSSLGLLYDIGLGVEPDDKESFKWYLKSAAQGDAGDQYNIGHMYETGNGVLQDYVKAYAYLNLAASNGSKDAQQNRDLLSTKMTKEQIAEAQSLTKTFAGSVNIPNTFTAGETAKTSEVNDNFSALETAVDDNDSIITTNVNNITSNDTKKLATVTPNKIINAAGKFLIDYILSSSKEMLGKRLVASQDYPVRIFLEKYVGEKSIIFKAGRIDGLNIVAAINLTKKFEANVVDPKTEALREANPSVFVRVEDPELHITEGGFFYIGSFQFKNHKVKCFKGEIYTSGSAQETKFITGSECRVNGTKYKYVNNKWQNVGG